MQQYKRDIEELERTAEAMEDAWNTCENYEETKAMVESLQDRYNQYHDLHTKETTIHASMQRLDIILSGKRKELSNLQTEFYNFKDLQKNLKKYQKIYDEMECVKNALSATKGGIPTIITKHYLADTESITNDLLNIAYDGEVQVEPFTITATEFSIPIYIKGYRLPDVKMASQGEVAFLSVALSFALISQSLRKTKRWDIMELDEVDGPLDQNNRRKFIEILEYFSNCRKKKPQNKCLIIVINKYCILDTDHIHISLINVRCKSYVSGTKYLILRAKNHKN